LHPRFTLDESQAFARLSGDFNPLHVDPVFARRTQFGGSVVHGIHAFLKAVESACGAALEDALPRVLSCTFSNPIRTGAGVSLTVAPADDGRSFRLSAATDGRPAFSATVEFGSASAMPAAKAERTGASFEPAPPRGGGLPPLAHEGAVPVRLDDAALERLFPGFARCASRDWIADLLATTRVVGMECPGLHSIYSGFKLTRRDLTDARGGPATMRYVVTKSDPRFRLVRMEVAGAALEGTLEAFVRPAPVAQMALSDVAAHVAADAYRGQRALVIGSSRGLGELTAKLLIAGGADVTLTYASGHADAERIAREAEAAGRPCSIVRLDVTAPGDGGLARVQAERAFTHVYYFASPQIARNPSAAWDGALFARFCAYYVDGFAAVCRALLATTPAGSPPPRFFFPSTVFLDAPEKGFAEYCAAKAAGEALCDYFARRHGAAFSRPRLPRMRTDQTSGLRDEDSAAPLPVMNALLPAFHAAGA